jgi:hypothetical protein
LDWQGLIQTILVGYALDIGMRDARVELELRQWIRSEGYQPEDDDAAEEEHHDAEERFSNYIGEHGLGHLR